MADIAMPCQSNGLGSAYDEIDSCVIPSRTLHQSDSAVDMVPNARFTFPAAPSDRVNVNEKVPSRMNKSSSMSHTQPSTETASSGTICQRRTANALPAFSFNPGSMASALPISTPPRSPNPDLNGSPARLVGHKRGGSEFIGGDVRPGGTGMMSTSPSKGDVVTPPPHAEKQLGLPAGRRGHAHRRSAAISNHDLSFMLQGRDTAPNSRAESAPVSPTSPAYTEARPCISELSEPLRSSSVPGPAAPSPDALVNEGTDVSASPQRPPSRMRVGFSERIEYIRPLSTISSETESSMSTIRGHSVSNSLSSIVGSVTSSPSASRSSRPSLITALEIDTRPSTAGAVLDTHGTPTDTNQHLNTLKRPMSALSPSSPLDSSTSSSPVHSKRRTVTDFESECSRSTPSLSLHTSSEKSKLALDSSFRLGGSEPTDEIDVVNKKPHRTSFQKNPLNVKSWATSFMSRRSKGSSERCKPAARPTSSPVCPKMNAFSANPTAMFSESSMLDTFDIDDTVTIVSGPTPALEKRAKPQVWTSAAGRKDSDASSPAIDLDAALDPLSSGNGQAIRNQGRGFSAARRTMHSSGFGVFNLGTQVHRRSESAPELVPFEYSPGQLSSSSTMADVFEEDEEELDKGPTSTGTASITSAREYHVGDQAQNYFPDGAGVDLSEADLSSRSSHLHTFDGGSTDIEQGDSLKSVSIPSRDQTPTPTSAPIIKTEGPGQTKADSVEVVEAYEEPRASELAATPTQSSVRKEITTQPLRISLPLPPQGILTPDTASSSFPSPVLSLGQNPMDTPRLSTATSCGTDGRPFSSASPVDHGHDIRASVDDVPSLTSSRSTMTSALQNTFPVFRPRRGSDRPSSLSSVQSVESLQRRKRNSIASLSKLVGASFVERSKLHIEHRPQSEHGIEVPKQSKQKKTKKRRLSKMMQFWKSKERL